MKVGERMSHVGRDVTILRSDSEWAPPFCQKLELKSERYNSVLDPNKNLRDIGVIVGMEI